MVTNESLRSMSTYVVRPRERLRRRTQQLVEELSVPPPGSQPLSFPSEFSRSRVAQYWVILWKNRKVYWRSPGARRPLFAHKRPALLESFTAEDCGCVSPLAVVWCASKT